MAETTKLTLFIPGTASSIEDWNLTLQRSGLSIEGDTLRGAGLSHDVGVEWVANDGSFGNAFSYGTVASDVIDVIERAPGALVLFWPIDLREGRRAVVPIVEHLQQAGALAVRIEESKLGWDIARWLQLFSSDDASDWHRGSVVYLTEPHEVQSCGMHAFSLPDVHLTVDGDLQDANDFATTFNVYQLAEDPVLVSGQTFRPDADTPRRVFERWPVTLYPPDHPCHNPYGVWRLGPPGGTARLQGALTMVFMPALCVVLRALEDKAEAPLTQQQVEAARDRAPCVAMEPRDAPTLERSRGYSDLEPELVWLQWQLVRQRGD